MLGEEGLFSGERRQYTATVDVETVLYEIDNERFLVVCKNNIFVNKLMVKMSESKQKNIIFLEQRAGMVSDRINNKL